MSLLAQIFPYSKRCCLMLTSFRRSSRDRWRESPAGFRNYQPPSGLGGYGRISSLIMPRSSTQIRRNLTVLVLHDCDDLLDVRWCAEHSVDYVVSIAKNDRLNALSARLQQRADGAKKRVSRALPFLLRSASPSKNVLVRLLAQLSQLDGA
jgi:hypothetical protein